MTTASQSVPTSGATVPAAPDGIVGPELSSHSEGVTKAAALFVIGTGYPPR